MLGPESDYLRDYFPSMVLSGIGVGFVFPQLSSVVAQALPPNRRGVGGAALQAGRQLGGTFGVARTIAFLGTATGISATMSAFDHIWWLIVIGGLATSALVLPLLTPAATVGAGAPHDRGSPPDAIRSNFGSDEPPVNRLIHSVEDTTYRETTMHIDGE